MEQLITWITETLAFFRLLMMGQLVTWFTAVLGWCSRTDVPSVDEFQATDSAHQVRHAVDSGQTSQAMDSPELESEASDEATESEASDSEAVDSGPTSQATDSAKPPEWYLDRATQCMERVRQMTSGTVSSGVVLNDSQCKYLAEKLETAIENSRESYCSSPPEHKLRYVEILKLLYRLAKEVESFIKDCCKDQWVQAALTSASVPVRVSELGCYLKLFTALLRKSNNLGAVVLTPIELESLRKAELDAVKEKASTDEANLWNILESLALPGNMSKTTDQFQLATILQKRLKAIQAMSSSGSPQWSNLEVWKVDGGSLRRFQMLGKGASAKVHKAKWFGAVEVAEKVFLVPSDPNFEKEVSSLAKLSHPNIVSFLGYKKDEGSCSIVTELMDEDLNQMMEKLRKLNKTRVAPFSILVACDTMLQVAEGVNYVHQKDFVHRDLKSQNVLVRRSTDNEVEYVCAKLADFGLSKTVARSITNSHQTSNTGSSRSMAPEVIELQGQGKRKQGATFTRRRDVYSFGMLCYEILTGDIPFSTIRLDREVKKEVLAGHRPPLPHQCPKDLRRLIEMCWDQDPSKRPTFPQICEKLRYLKYGLLIESLAKPLEWYLDLATKCMKLVRQMTQRVKLHSHQCKYLVGKLEMAVETSREHYIRSSSPEHGFAEVAAYRRTLMFLCRLATEVETFIYACCKDEWMLTALTSTIIVSARVSSWGYYLELCTMLSMRIDNNVGVALVTPTELKSLRKAELDAVKEKASIDEATLLSNLESLIQSSKSKTTDHFQLATILQERLRRIQAISSLGSPLSYDLSSFEITSRTRPQKRKNLGKGSAGSVYLGIWMGAQVAIKTFDGGNDHYFKLEASILAGLHHPNIVNMLGSYINGKDECSIVTELMDTDLSFEMDRRLRARSRGEAPFNIDVAVDLMLQVAEGVDYLHRHRIVHRDLKSMNILVKHAKATEMKMEHEFLSIQVADFGSSKTKERSITYSNQTLNVGTTRWMAPELIRVIHDGSQGRNSRLVSYPFKSDVYSFSMLCYEILTGNVPFSMVASPTEVKKMVLEGVRPELPHHCPPALKALIKAGWLQDPSQRPSFTEICEELRYLKCISLLPEPSNRIQRYQAAHVIAEPLEVPELTIAAQPITKALDLSGLSLTNIEFSCLERGIQLGKGGAETVVYKTIYHPTEELEAHVAQKRFLGAYNEEFKKEVTILADLKHSNIVSLVGYAMDTIRSCCSIVMELMDRDLHDLIWRRTTWDLKTTPTGPFFIDEAVDIMLQIAQGMDHVHQRNVVHRDLKSYNILLWSKNKKNHFHVKVADFGLSERLKPGSYLRFNIGTLNWMAPEVMRLKKDEDMDVGMSTSRTSSFSSTFLYFSNAIGKIPLLSEKKIKNYPDPFKSDIYSFGIVCFEILTGNAPTFHPTNVRSGLISNEVFKKNPQKAAIFLLFIFLEGIKFKDPQIAAVVLLLLLEGLSFKKDPQKAIVVLLLLHLKFKKDPIEVLKEKVRAGHRPLIPDYCPPKLKTLIESCWDADASTRPSFAQIIVDLKHVLR